MASASFGLASTLATLNKRNPHFKEVAEEFGIKGFKCSDAKKLEETCIKTVESGEMTKDLAILINKDQKWLNTQDFLSAIKNNFQIN